jgi:hypothetical protein
MIAKSLKKQTEELNKRLDRIICEFGCDNVIIDSNDIFDERDLNTLLCDCKKHIQLLTEALSQKR